MKCQVCGNESGNFVLCSDCNARRQKGDVVKCSRCGNWHFTNKPCINCISNPETDLIYELKSSLLSPIEKEYFRCIKSALPEGYSVYPQINLASIINRTDIHSFQNELFRNIDFGVFDKDFAPVFLIEIQDKTHLNAERKNRDSKIKKICEEAGITIVEFWNVNKVDMEEVSTKITEALNAPPLARKSNHKKINSNDTENITVTRQKKDTPKPLKGFESLVKGILLFLSFMSTGYSTDYMNTGALLPFFICSIFPAITFIVGLVLHKKGVNSAASIVLGALLTLILWIYPFIQ
ncbi:MAG: DUF2726 domain-containing protein [Clostridia bacterium]|nr:DUF2726 domain-containing protein [Clostridia bacterium]